MSNPSPSPDQLRKAAILKFDASVADIDVMAQDVIKLLQESVHRFKTQLFDGLGYKGQGLSKDDVAALTKLTAAFNSATDAQIRLDKTAKERVKRMTHDEHKAAMVAWLMRLPTKERTEWILDLVRRHDAAKDETGGRRLLDRTSLAGVRAEAGITVDPQVAPDEHQ